MLKKILFCFAILALYNSYGQENATSANKNESGDRTEYLISPQKAKLKTIGFYFAPEMGVSQLNKSTAPIGAGSFMFLINKKLGIGFTGQITSNPNNKAELLKLGYGGVKLEYTIKPNAKVHTTIPLVIGTGFANNDSLAYRYGSPNRPHRGGLQQDYYDKNNFSQFFILQPGVNIEANLVRFVKIFGGINYRLATKLENNRNGNITAPITASQASGITATIGIKIGLFDYQLHKRDSLARKNKKEQRFRNHN